VDAYDGDHFELQQIRNAPRIFSHTVVAYTLNLHSVLLNVTQVCIVRTRTKITVQYQQHGSILIFLQSSTVTVYLRVGHGSILLDPIQSDPRCVSVFRPTSNPIHRTPGGENNFTCIQKSVQHFELTHEVTDVNNNNNNNSS